MKSNEKRKTALRLSKALDDGEVLYITYANGRYWLKSRNYLSGGVDWDTHFEVSLSEARDIVNLLAAHWWHLVDESVK